MRGNMRKENQEEYMRTNYNLRDAASFLEVRVHQKKFNSETTESIGMYTDR